MAVETIKCNGREWSLRGTCRPPGDVQAYSHIEGSVWVDFYFLHTRGTEMENKTKPNLKIKTGSKITTTKASTPDVNMETEIFRRSFSTPRSPPARVLEPKAIQRDLVDRGVSVEKMIELDTDSDSIEENSVLADIRQERKALEEFLFNENNKISKNAIKFILTKWSFLENKLYENRLESEKLKYTYQKKGPSMTYAMAASCPMGASTPAMKPETEKKEIRNEHEVILIKPTEDMDKRNNEQIKQDLIKGLDGLRNKLRIRGIRQMRNKGIVIEVKDKQDVDLIKQMDLKKMGLRTGEPNRLNPSLIIYDIESDYKIDELKEDLVNKNFENLDKKILDELKKEINFKFSIKDSEDRVHWIVQMPGLLYRNLITKSRVFMMWRTYKIKEFLNITRCFKCHGYGHIAKKCEVPDQLCETCGVKDHIKTTCSKRNTPSCINCVRNKRKDVNHSVRSLLCPEYRRHVEIYRHKIKWD